MTLNRINPNYQETMYRPVFEMNSVAMWLAASGVSLAQSVLNGGAAHSLSLVSAAVCLGVAAQRARKAYPMVNRQIQLLTNKMEFLEIGELRLINKEATNRLKAGTTGPDGKEVVHKYDDRNTYLCEGFEWGAEHANRAYQVMGMSSDFSEIKFPLVYKHKEKAMRATTKKLGGKPWIHGMGDSKRIMMHEEAYYGHTFITGNVGTGKTTLMKLLTLNQYHMKNVIIVIDPKNDADWRRAIQSEMERNGEGDKFHYFNPSTPSKSVRLNPLKNYTRTTEISSRISSLQQSKEGPSAFTEFGWQVINKVVEACVFTGEAPTLVNIQQYLEHDKDKLMVACVKRHFDAVLGADWVSDKTKEISKMGVTVAEQFMNYYRERIKQTYPCKEVDGMIGLVEHDASHYQKMVVGLLPLFTILNASPLDEMLSPTSDVEEDDIEDYEDFNAIKMDTTKAGASPIVDTKTIIEEGGVLYMALDSLSDSKTSGYLARLIIQDLAATAGERYSHEGTSDTRISIFVDEVHAAVAGNEALLSLLAQGRAASIQVFLATQTIPDLEDQVGTSAAKRYLGLCNNFISMRVNDDVTQEYVSKQFGDTDIVQQQVMMAQSASSDASINDFGGSFAQRLSKIKDAQMPPQLLGDLPKLQFMGRFQDGRKIKGRLKILTENKQ